MISTPHITCKKEDIAETVLMPGDPLRAKFVAETFLENVLQFNSVRGMLGFTGFYKGKRVSVMGSGMGCPSIGIYSYELFNIAGAKRIMRIGSAGGIDPALGLRDIVAAMSVCTDSNFTAQYRLPGQYAPTASFPLLRAAMEEGERQNARIFAGSVLCTDIFYDDGQSLMEWKKMGVLAVEMESVALYCNAARAGKEALTLLTISDLPFTGEACTADERQTSFTTMMQIALEIA